METHPFLEVTTPLHSTHPGPPTPAKSNLFALKNNSNCLNNFFTNLLHKNF